MTQEIKDFQYFIDNQLHNFDPITGQLDTKFKNNTGVYTDARIFKDIGSKNEDGYVRVWANGKLRMKHRLVYFIVHGVLPDEGYEIDHIDNNRANNAPSNLCILSKSKNNSSCNNRKFGKQLNTEQVHLICALLQDTELSDLDIANQVGRSRGTVRDIKTRRTRTSISKDYSWNHRIK